MTGNNSKIGGGGFHHLAIRVKDFDASMKFYIEGLGFRKEIQWGECNNRMALLDTGDGDYFELFAGNHDSENPVGALMHVALRTENCDAALKQAVVAGAVVTMEPTDGALQTNPPTLIRVSFCKGPDGELLEFFQYR